MSVSSGYYSHVKVILVLVLKTAAAELRRERARERERAGLHQLHAGTSLYIMWNSVGVDREARLTVIRELNIPEGNEPVGSTFSCVELPAVKPELLASPGAAATSVGLRK